MDDTKIMNTGENKTGSGLGTAGPIVQLSKEYEFEGEKISEIDFSGHTEMTAADMVKIDRILVTSGNIAISSEGTLAYSLVFAAECTKRPVEFFERLNPQDAIRIKNTVMGFLNGRD